MHFCRNWGDPECDPEVAKYKNPKELKNGEDIPLWPEGEELVRLNHICLGCEVRFFEIEERVCPVCGGTDFTEVRGFIIQDEKDREKFLNFYLKCRQCETPSVLKKEF